MLRDIRKQYSQSALNEKEANENPFLQFQLWLDTALKSGEQEPTAMILSTVDHLHQPQARVVLLKDFTEEGFMFYTNYESNKAHQIIDSNNVHLLFFWETLERQVRITGKVEKLPSSVSDNYFSSRPADSKIGAWASEQSSIVPSSTYLDERFDFFKKKFGENIPRPDHWGGYLVRPFSFEFWQGRPNRMHDRLFYSKKNNSNSDWKMNRLAP